MGIPGKGFQIIPLSLPNLQVSPIAKPKTYQNECERSLENGRGKAATYTAILNVLTSAAILSCFVRHLPLCAPNMGVPAPWIASPRMEDTA